MTGGRIQEDLVGGTEPGLEQRIHRLATARTDRRGFAFGDIGSVADAFDERSHDEREPEADGIDPDEGSAGTDDGHEGETEQRQAQPADEDEQTRQAEAHVHSTGVPAAELGAEAEASGAVMTAVP